MTICPKCPGVCRMREQAAWSAEQVAAYVETPIPYEILPAVPVEEMVLGLSVSHVCWTWKPYERRAPNHQADYDRLLVSIYHQGVKTPVIGWRHPDTGRYHVLIGQRRLEIAQRLGIRSLPVLVILEDARGYWQNDIARIDRHLKPAAGEWRY